MPCAAEDLFKLQSACLLDRFQAEYDSMWQALKDHFWYVAWSRKTAFRYKLLHTSSQKPQQDEARHPRLKIRLLGTGFVGTPLSWDAIRSFCLVTVTGE